jgi:hypothetical protein
MSSLWVGSVVTACPPHYPPTGQPQAAGPAAGMQVSRTTATEEVVLGHAGAPTS